MFCSVLLHGGACWRGVTSDAEVNSGPWVMWLTWTFLLASLKKAVKLKSAEEAEVKPCGDGSCHQPHSAFTALTWQTSRPQWCRAVTPVDGRSRTATAGWATDGRVRRMKGGGWRGERRTEWRLRKVERDKRREPTCFTRPVNFWSRETENSGKRWTLCRRSSVFSPRLSGLTRPSVPSCTAPSPPPVCSRTTWPACPTEEPQPQLFETFTALSDSLWLSSDNFLKTFRSDFSRCLKSDRMTYATSHSET